MLTNIASNTRVALNVDRFRKMMLAGVKRAQIDKELSKPYKPPMNWPISRDSRTATVSLLLNTHKNHLAQTTDISKVGLPFSIFTACIISAQRQHALHPV